MQALIDGDIIAYRIGFSCEKKDENGDKVLTEPIETAYSRVDTLMEYIIAATSSDSYRVFLSGSTNYRYSYNPDYKANRTKNAKPIYLNEIREYLVVRWNAEITENGEADDAMGIAQYSNYIDTVPKFETVICSIDKDLKQIPGIHFNFVTGDEIEVSEEEGIRFFYEQLLIGDGVDNIFGVAGIGKAKAPRIINPCETELEMFEAVQSRYDSDERLLMNGVCLWIQRRENEIWKFPDGSTTTLPDEGDTSQDDVSIQEQTGGQYTSPNSGCLV